MLVIAAHFQTDANVLSTQTRVHSTHTQAAQWSHKNKACSRRGINSSRWINMRACVCSVQQFRLCVCTRRFLLFLYFHSIKTQLTRTALAARTRFQSAVQIFSTIFSVVLLLSIFYWFFVVVHLRLCNIFNWVDQRRNVFEFELSVRVQRPMGFFVFVFFLSFDFYFVCLIDCVLTARW